MTISSSMPAVRPMTASSPLTATCPSFASSHLTVSTPYRSSLHSILCGFRPASDEILERRKLLRRVDSKFLVPASVLETILGGLTADYGVLKARGEALARYESLYFDTADLSCFHDHRRGRRPRQKIRVRHYPDREVSFLEVKTKKNEFLTIKERLQRPYGENRLDLESFAFLDRHCRLPASQLVPQVWTNFHRLTLIGVSTNERVTLDVDLQVVRGENRKSLPGLVIVEVKQAHFSARTPVMTVMRSLGLRPASASKYCTAIVVTSEDEIRTNRILPALRAVERMAA